MSQASMEAARGFIQAYNGADWDRLEAMLTPDCLYDEVGSGQRAQGPREIAGVFKGPVPRPAHGGDTAVLEVTWNGTFTGPWATPQGEVEPTGKHQTSRACVLLMFEGDTIKEAHQYFDSMSLMQQLGMLEAPASV
jgi:ketosteroid isomerase-like protein